MSLRLAADSLGRGWRRQVQVVSEPPGGRPLNLLELLRLRVVDLEALCPFLQCFQMFPVEAAENIFLIRL